LAKNFKRRRGDATRDQEILVTQTGMLCNSRTDFNVVDLYLMTRYSHSPSELVSCLRRRRCGSAWAWILKEKK